MNRCPSYDNLLWFVDTGDAASLAGHDPAACARCAGRLREYAAVRAHLGELRGAETAAGAREPAPAGPDVARLIAGAKAALRVTEPVFALLREAREHYHRDWPAVRRLGEEALARLRALPDAQTSAERTAQRAARAEAESILGNSLLRTGAPEDALVVLHRSVAHWEEIGEPVGHGNALINLCSTLHHLGDLPAAYNAALRAYQMLKDCGQTDDAAKALHQLGVLQYELGDSTAGLFALRRAAQLFREVGAEIEWAQATQALGWMALAAGKPEEALAAAEVEHFFARKGDRLDAAHCRRLAGEALLRCNDEAKRQAGLAKLAAARGEYAALGQWIDAALVTCLEAESALRAGDRHTAQAQMLKLHQELPADQHNRWVAEAVALLAAKIEQGEISELLSGLARLSASLQLTSRNKTAAFSREPEN